MDKIVLAIEGFEPPRGQYVISSDIETAARQYLATLQKLPDAARHMILLDPKLVLQALNPTDNPIGYLFVLDLLLQSPSTMTTDNTRQLVLHEIVNFILTFNVGLIRHSGSLFRTLLKAIANGSLYTPPVAIELLAHAILRIDPSGSMFTSAHLLLAELAYDANCIQPALKIIDSDILFFPKMPRSALSRMMCEIDHDIDVTVLPTTVFDDLVSPATILEYQLLRSLIYISRRDWARAQAALEQLITHPTKHKGLSKIIAEGHRKWVLVGLLNKGKAPALPSSVSGTVKHMLGALNSAYDEVAKLFSMDDSSKMREAIQNQAQTWQDDGNETLMDQVAQAYEKWQIINLRQIYHRISISQIRNLIYSAERTSAVSPQDEEISLLIDEMIRSGMLKGELQVGSLGEESYLTFQEESEVMTEVEFAAAIAQSHRNVSRLSQQYRVTNDRFSLNGDYIKQVIREQKMVEREGPDAGVGFDAHIEDEDLMTGVMSHN